MQMPNFMTRSSAKPAVYASPQHRKGLLKGVALTIVLAVLAGRLAEAPFFSVMGAMVLSIVCGAIWKSAMDVPKDAGIGIAFSSKFLLRAGIILMGIRLDFKQILDAGLPVIAIDMIVIAFTLSVMIGLGNVWKVDKHLSVLIAVGTAVCGAAAIVAVAPLVGAKKENTAVSISCIALLGTIGAIAYILLYPYLGIDPYLYGVFAGSTLHELAHVIAAGVPGGDVGSETAIVVKLGRVALLIPVALLLGYLYRDKAPLPETGNKKWKNMPVPWFIFGFLAMSLINTTGLLPESAVRFLIAASVFLMSAAMAGLGLSIQLADFKKVDKKVIALSVTGFVALSLLGQGLLQLFY